MAFTVFLKSLKSPKEQTNPLQFDSYLLKKKKKKRTRKIKGLLSSGVSFTGGKQEEQSQSVREWAIIESGRKGIHGQ